VSFYVWVCRGVRARKTDMDASQPPYTQDDPPLVVDAEMESAASRLERLLESEKERTQEMAPAIPETAGDDEKAPPKKPSKRTQRLQRQKERVDARRGPSGSSARNLKAARETKKRKWAEFLEFQQTKQEPVAKEEEVKIIKKEQPEVRKSMIEYMSEPRGKGMIQYMSEAGPMEEGEVEDEEYEFKDPGAYPVEEPDLSDVDQEQSRRPPAPRIRRQQIMTRRELQAQRRHSQTVYFDNDDDGFGYR